MTETAFSIVTKKCLEDILWIDCPGLAVGGAMIFRPHAVYALDVPRGWAAPVCMSCYSFQESYARWGDV